MLNGIYISKKMVGAVLAMATLSMPPAFGTPLAGLSLYGPQDLKYDWSKDTHFKYVNPNAPKGGELRFGTMGGATKLNPYTLKGYADPFAASLVFETLMVPSYDPAEPFSSYGHIAQKAEIAEDRLSVTYWLNPKARWDDGKPITADDVMFTFALLDDPGFIPFFRNYFSEVKRLEKVDDMTVRFHLKSAENQELALITGQMPVMPEHVYGVPGKNFGEDFQNVLAGSGPYRVKAYDFNTQITLERNPDWWARELPSTQGMYNFDTIHIRFYQDLANIKTDVKNTNPAARLDLARVNSSGDWIKEYNNPLVDNNWLLKKKFYHERLPDMQCLLFNLRNPLFGDARIRRAISSALDFDRLNRDMFYNLYIHQNCFWDNHPEMMSKGPADGVVRDLLVELNRKYGDAAVPQSTWLRGPYNLDTDMRGGKMPIQERVFATSAYLDSLGWKYDAKRGVRIKDGIELKFEIILTSPAWLRIVGPLAENLKRMGIKCTPRMIQTAELQKKADEFDFDMLFAMIRTSESPGNELIAYFHSSSAGTPGGHNLAGISNPAVDEVIESILVARTRKDLVNRVKILDRILCAHHYVIPSWYANYDRMVYWNRLSYPENMTTKLEYPYNVMSFWWVDEEKCQRLEQAMEAGEPIE